MGGGGEKKKSRADERRSRERRIGMSRSCRYRSRRSGGSRIVLKRDEQSFRVYSNTMTGATFSKRGRSQLGALPPFGEGMSPNPDFSVLRILVRVNSNWVQGTNFFLSTIPYTSAL
jgi:hypothetical protein